MNDMNELTNKLQQVMVPKAALIAYEYRENRYGNGMHYLELHPINDRGRMEAAMPVTYEPPLCSTATAAGKRSPPLRRSSWPLTAKS